MLWMQDEVSKTNRSMFSSLHFTFEYLLDGLTCRSPPPARPSDGSKPTDPQQRKDKVSVSWQLVWNQGPTTLAASCFFLFLPHRKRTTYENLWFKKNISAWKQSEIKPKFPSLLQYIHWFIRVRQKTKSRLMCASGL